MDNMDMDNIMEFLINVIIDFAFIFENYSKI
jgi:hypothetical protein